MSHYLRQLNDRAQSSSVGIRPQLPSLFEPLTGDRNGLALDLGTDIADQRPEPAPAPLRAAPMRRGADAEDGGRPAEMLLRSGRRRATEEPARPHSDEVASPHAGTADQLTPRTAAAPVVPPLGWFVDAPLPAERPLVAPAGQPGRDRRDAASAPGVSEHQLSARSDAAIDRPQPAAWSAAPRPFARLTIAPAAADGRPERRPREETGAIAPQPKRPRTTATERIAAAERNAPAVRVSLPNGAAIQPVIVPARIPPPFAPAVAGTQTPTIHVTIGRVEVRAVPPATPPSRSSVATAPRLTLEEYLRQRAAGDSR